MDLKQLVEFALAEDIGSGDITSELTIDAEKNALARVIARTDGVLSGSEAFAEVFHQIDATLSLSWSYHDGEYFPSEAEICQLEGKARSILTGERTALNFMGRLTGVATLTRRYVDLVRHTKTTILDTRKTTPLLRSLEKQAVVHGGGSNHRFGLYDMILVKDNHEDAAGSLTISLKNLFRQLNRKIDVEVEVRNLAQLHEALAFPVQRILLDNFTTEMMTQAVQLVNSRIPLEVSGGVTPENVSQYAGTGVDFISVGALTHSASCHDFSMQITL